ncbi:hypothetical protein Verru16b_00170 [Lacunisphaera limnophila]|uniref:Ice-binding protein C-terminal domain-containing protein n=1 Tax=Lacunisphaera limnophila TaxID=1838286 RepID=A0A1I7PHP0_9BACT|nr:PEP-CTERM sorting domain-containing protein [Lacunisphaera limnophila]AOS43129.1 hypothetical protein Verru16b_00170 [Lacunisphaera limnophila]
MSFPRPGYLLLIALLLLGVRAAAQQVVNIDVKISFVPVYVGQGAYADPGHDYWNAVTSGVGATALLASDGVTTTTLSFAMDDPEYANIGFGGDQEFAGNLLADYFYMDGATPTAFTLGGLTPGHAYDIYLYSQAGSSYSTDRAATFTLDGSTQGLTAFTIAAYEEGTNYVRFSVTATGTSLGGSFIGSLGFNEAELNGLQIVDHGVAAIPEPSTYAALAGLAALALVARRRPRR